jgi:pyridoxal phosphate enzyme (YggS family)
VAAAGLNAALARIAAAATRVDRAPEEVTLVVVTKGRTDQQVRAAHAAGQRHFGENRPDALAARLASDLPQDITWHFVGTIQRRRVRDVVPGAAFIHSVDRLSLARAIVARERPPPVLLQVNIGREPQKFGFSPDDVDDAADAVVGMSLDLRGLMAIPPRPSRSEDSRQWFVAMRELRDRIAASHPNAVELSMGMSDDFDVAVESGATIVRLGRAIFDVEAPPGDAPPTAPR